MDSAGAVQRSRTRSCGAGEEWSAPRVLPALHVLLGGYVSEAADACGT